MQHASSRGAHLLSRADRNGQPVLAGRVRTVVLGVVVAGWMIRPIEIDHVETRRGAIQIHVAARRVRLGAARQIGEGDEQVVQVG